jgi:hypothetical protein
MASVAVVVAVAVGWCLYQGASASLHAEHVLHAALLVVELLQEHVEQHDGEWPRSWGDLEALPPRRWGMFEWPKDSHDIQRYVAVDFSVDPMWLAMQTVDQFDAVRPIGPYYPFKDKGSIAALLKALRERKGKGR